MRTLPPLSFPASPDDFPAELRRRVDAYFSERGISKKANLEMWTKCALVALATLGSYALLLTAEISPWSRLLIWGALGFCMLQVSIGIAHDGTHNALSADRRVNRWLGRLFDVMGISTFAWPTNHLASHHAGPNVGVYDAAIDSNPALRLHPKARLGPAHRVQWLSFPLLYAMATLQKWFFLDYFTMIRGRIGAMQVPRLPPGKWALLIGSKLGVYTYGLLVPLLVLDDPAIFVLGGFLCMHVVAGLSVGVIFQVTHLADSVSFVEPGSDGAMPLDFTRHTFATTSEFCRTSRLANHLCGGLNVHVTHHLFPDICHVHLPQLTDIVKQTAEEYGVAFHSYPTVWAALASHSRRLHHLGRVGRAPVLRPS